MDDKFFSFKDYDNRDRELTGMEELRMLVGNCNLCEESFLDQFSVSELIQLHRMMLICKWDFLPDQWTEKQVQDALKGKPPEWDDDEQPIENHDFSDLTREIDRSLKIFNSKADWEDKYDLIFNRHKNTIHPMLKSLGLRFDWYDPDTSYEEDVTAYVDALKDLKVRIDKLSTSSED